MKRKSELAKDFSSDRELKMKKAFKKQNKSKTSNYEDPDDWDEYELSKIRNREKLEDFFDDGNDVD